MRLEDFEGSWTLSRVIRDRLSGSDGSFEGRAVFSRVPEGLSYREEGLLRLGPGPALRAERGYLWQEAGGRILVRYADGRPFHDFDPETPGAQHFCDPDDYAVDYDFGSWPHWQAEWVVRGPRKDYTMLSRYSPA